MTVHLLDVNVLLALHDPMHPLHRRTFRWFQEVRDQGWATCPITENGFVRISSNPKIRGLGLTPPACAAALSLTCASNNHQFWPDDISVRDLLTSEMRMTHRQFPDLYLLALAIAHGGKLATFDRKIPAHLLAGGTGALELIPVAPDPVP